MENLYIETQDGRKSIDPKVIEKYKLEKGLISPFSRKPITGKFGEYPSETSIEKDPRNNGGNDIQDDGENVMFSTSEVLDFAQATDSPTGN